MDSHILNYILNKTKYTTDGEAFGMSHHFEKREEAITKYIESASKSHACRLVIKNVFQIIITSILLFLLLVFAGMFIFVILYSSIKQIEGFEVVVALISSAGAFISSLFALLFIILKYVFPKTDDENSKDLLKTAIEVDSQYYDKNMSSRDTKK